MITILLNHLTSKEVLDSKLLAIQIPYVCMLQEQLLITLQLASIDLDSFLEKNLNVYAVYTPSNQGTIFFMNAVGLMIIRTQKGTP